MAENLKLSNCFTISIAISKLQFFLKNRFDSNWRSHLLLTSDQKPKKSLGLFLRKISVSDFGLIWRRLREHLQINIFYKNPSLSLFYLYSLLTSCKKLEKSLEPFLRKLRYQPTNQPINTNNTDVIGPRWHRSNTTLQQPQRIYHKYNKI